MMKSIIKYQGGKYKLLPNILPLINSNGKFIDAFTGSGVVGFNASNDSVILNDKNQDIANLYLNVKNNYNELLKYIIEFFKFNNEESYYLMRKLHNTTDNKVMKSALYVYINKHCFNGNIRYNKKNEINCAYRKYKKVNVPLVELDSLNLLLNSKDIQIYNKDYLEILKMAEPGDTIYLDPPYVPLNKDSFTKYLPDTFNLDSHEELKNEVERLYSNNISSIISNVDTPYTRYLYRNATAIIPIQVTRSISCKSSSRGKVSELIALFKA